MALRLKATEELLYRLIAAPARAADAVEPEIGSAGPGAIVLDDGRIDPAARVEIYAGMYFHRLLDALAEDFPATRTALGDERFHDAVAGYLQAHPPSHFSISECGRDFADYLRRDPAFAEFPYAPDLARVERALIVSFHAADAPPLDGDAMRRVAAADWPALRMRTHPATLVVDLQWRIGELMRSVQEQRPLPEPVAQECAMLVWRRRNQVYHREIDPAERAGLAAAADGAAFSVICAAVAEAGDAADPAGQMARMLRVWLGDAVLIAD